MSGLMVFDRQSEQLKAIPQQECPVATAPQASPQDLSSLRQQAFEAVLLSWLEHEGVPVRRVPQGEQAEALGLAVQDVELQGTGLGDRLVPAVALDSLLKIYHPEALRYYLLSASYRRGLGLVAEVRCPTCSSPMSESAQDDLLCDVCDTDSDDASLQAALQLPGLDAADAQVAYVYDTLLGAARVLAVSPPPEPSAVVMPAVQAMQASFRASLNDDLNTERALKVLAEPLKEANRLTQSGKGIDPAVRASTLQVFVQAMREVGSVLGLFAMEPLDFIEARRGPRARHLGLDPQHIDDLVRARETARSQKDWARADAARAELDGLGVRVTDSPNGSIWSL